MTRIIVDVAPPADVEQVERLLNIPGVSHFLDDGDGLIYVEVLEPKFKDWKMVGRAEREVTPEKLHQMFSIDANNVVETKIRRWKSSYRWSITVKKMPPDLREYNSLREFIEREKQK